MSSQFPINSIYEEEKRYLKQIYKLLAGTTLSCEFCEDDEIGCSIVLQMATEGPSAEVSLVIQLQKQPVGERDFHTGQKIPTVISIVFLASLPFTIPQPELTDVLLLLNFINTTYPLSGFEIEMIEMRPQFKYCLINSVSEINKTVLFSIVGAIMLAINQYLPFIRDVATKKITLEEVFQQFLPSDIEE